MSLVLHVFPPSPRAFKVLLAANHLGIDYRLQLVNLGAGDHRTPEHTKLNANQRMPVLADDGYVLWESNAILEYLAAIKPDAKLMPQQLRPRLQIAKWLYWESAHWDQACSIFVFERVVKPIFGLGETSQSEIERGTMLLNRLAKVLDQELQKHRYISGDALTIADLSLVAPLCLWNRAQLPLDSYAAIRRWSEDIKALPAWDATIALQRPG